MNGIILAAGQGTRLMPLTEKKPKCMVEIFGKSMIERQIEIFRNCGIDDISIVTGYQSEMIDFPGINFFHNEQFATTNMLETLFCAREKLSDSVIISYGDIIFEKPILQKLINVEDKIAVIVDYNWKKLWELRFENILDDAESMKIDDMGFIQNLGEKVEDVNEIGGQYIGLMKFSDEGLTAMIEMYDKARLISKSGRNLLNKDMPFEKSYMTDFLQAIINSGTKVKSIPIQGGWLEIDTFTDYQKYNELYNNNKISDFINTKEI